MLSSILKRSKIKTENNIDPSAEQTRNMNIEITSLSNQTNIKEGYINDIENSLSLNRQAATILFEYCGKENSRMDLVDRFHRLASSNQDLLEEIKQCRQEKENALAEVNLLPCRS